uniref:C-type lectin domain-containing protein n=1 Tax=Branchiostoma floridae TaxID=7739 RepID=C3ZVF1_BRAFL|eukprot:XP_002587461.1 hypothetical protein BRAFLDRAFT_100142 [Branchiostoma floridae]
MKWRDDDDHAPTYYNPLDHESTFFTPNGHTMDEGVSGSALKLESRRSQYANLGNFAGTCFGSTLNCPRGFSLAFWFKRPDGDIHAQYYINSGGHDPTRTRGFTLTKTLVDLDNDLYTFAVNGRLFRHQAKVYLLPDLWTHVAVTWLEERGLEIFVNGSVQQVAVFETKIPPLENDPYTDVYLGSDNIRPGMYTHTGEAVFDELKFWDWVLPDGQIQLAMIPGSASQCQSGWERYNNHCYKPMPDYADWSTASSRCKQQGASLASIKDSDENTFIATFGGIMKARDKTFRAIPSFWLGLHKESEQWKWTDGSRVDYTNWAPGEPNNSMIISVFQGEECGTMYYKTGTNRIWCGLRPRRPGQWNDESCSSSRRYICKKPI